MGAQGLGESIGAEAAGRKVDDLPVGEVRREPPREIFLRESGQRRENEIGAAHGLADVERRHGNRDIARAAMVFQAQPSAGQNGREGCRVLPPEANVVAGLAHVGRSRIGSVAAAENCDFHAPPFPPCRRRSRHRAFISNLN